MNILSQKYQLSQEEAQQIADISDNVEYTKNVMSVSYTHLDVYKRQALNILGGVKVYRRISNSECHRDDDRESDGTR